MDKRYLVIILIVGVCLVNLFFISQSSDVIGSASVNVDKYTFSIPLDFMLMDTYPNYVTLSNDKMGLNVAVYVLKGEYNISEVLSTLKNNTDYKILSEGSVNTSDIKIDTIYFESHDPSVNIQNHSTFYFKKYDTFFKVEMNNFDYNTEKNFTLETIDYIVDSLRINHKK